jgi:hypothetical protein
MDNGSQHISEPSFASLLGGIANDAKDLLLQEVASSTFVTSYAKLRPPRSDWEKRVCILG